MGGCLRCGGFLLIPVEGQWLWQSGEERGGASLGPGNHMARIQDPTFAYQLCNLGQVTLFLKSHFIFIYKMNTCFIGLL